MDEIRIISSIRQVIKDHKSFAIVGHIKPDGDAIGSCRALALALEKTGKEAYVVLDDASDRYSMIPGEHFSFNGDIYSLSPDIFICVDCSAYDRLGESANIIGNSEYVVCIDHHLYSSINADYSLIDDKASSTAELIYRLLNGFIELDHDIASAIYAGMVYDTGGFRHSCTTPEVYRIAANLMEYDIPFTRIYNELMYCHSAVEAAVFGEALSHMKVIEPYGFAYTVLSGADMQKHGASPKDCDGITEYLLNTQNVSCSAFLYEANSKEIKVSFRSKEEDISRIANKFGGGGHINAAGCTIFAPLDDAVEMILAEFEK